MSHLQRLLLAVVVVAIAAGSAAADTLFLRDGGKLHGTVANHEQYRPYAVLPDSITLALDSATIMRVPLEDVAQILLEDGGHARLLEVTPAKTTVKPVAVWGGITAASRPIPRGPSLRAAGAGLLVTGIAMATVGAAVKFGHARVEFFGSEIDLGDYYNEMNYVMMGAGGASAIAGAIMLSAEPGSRGGLADTSPRLHAALVTRRF